MYYASKPLGKMLQLILARKYLELKKKHRESEWSDCFEFIGAKPKLAEGDYSEAENIVVCDPSSFPAMTMAVPRETALKILFLGEMP
jgi:hypothetical protein